MNPQAMALFRALADRSPSEREAYYVRQRVPDPVRAEVESLLRFDDGKVGSLEARIAAAANAALGHSIPGESATNDDDTRLQASEIGEGRFEPGTLLADRYRIVSLARLNGASSWRRAIAPRPRWRLRPPCPEATRWPRRSPPA